MRIMKKFLAVILMMACIAGSVRAATSPLYVNQTFLTTPPQVDALAFLNQGTIDIFTTLPFYTFNTRFFTNRGFLAGQPGWQVDHVSSFGRGKMDTFVNQGIMEGQDFGGFFSFVGDDGLIQVVPGGASSVSYLLVNATNVFNRGLLSVGAGGLMKIQAHNADLSFSGLRSNSDLGGSGGGSDGLINDGTNYFNAPGIQDVYWGIGTNQALAETRGRPLDLGIDGTQFFPPTSSSPLHEVQSVLASSNSFFNISVPAGGSSGGNYQAFVYTNQLSASNALVQVVLITPSLNNGEITAGVRFAPGGMGARVPVVRIATTGYDSVLNAVITNAVFLSDDLLTRSNIFLSLNNNGTTGRPVNYRVSTSPTAQWLSGAPPNTPFNPQAHIWNPQFSPQVVTNSYTGYSFSVNEAQEIDIAAGFGDLPSRGFNLGNPFTSNLFDPTNRQGRVEIEALDSVDLRNTRLRANQYLSIKSPHVLVNESTSLDTPLLSLDVGNVEGSLEVDDFVPSTVERISGRVSVYSASWTNQLVTITTAPEGVSSNIFVTRHHVMIVGNQQVDRVVPVTVTEANLAATNIFIGDDMNILRGLKLTAENVFLASELSLVQDLVDLGPANFPGVINLANVGEVRNTGNTRFVNEPGSTLETFNNTGLWQSRSHEWEVDEFRSVGLLQSLSGPMRLTARQGNIRLGGLVSNSDMFLNFEDLDAALSVLLVGSWQTSNGLLLSLPGKLHINVTGNFNDGGTIANNYWTVTDGFEMLAKPANGDFRGTLLESLAFQFKQVRHKWGATDLGMSTEGYLGNAAVGHLSLIGEFASQFVFDTVNGNNAMYVDYLEISNWTAANLEQGLDIRPGMRIYFSQSNFPVDQLDGLFEGRLRHLPAPSGGPSTIVTLASGQEFRVRDGLIAQMDVDSDADGIPNALDPFPFDDVKVKVEFSQKPAPKALISWLAAPRTKYELQYKDDVAAPVWQTLTNFITYSDQRTIMVEDPGSNGGKRYYRVIYSP